mgnify:FL=1|tara:strand:+ start:417 stop:860 length:444 start_codon:yes stop_codon:yes gene_type:complete
MSTIVGTNIEVTNLKYDSDTTSMIISNAGQVTVQGEGTATTNLQQGLAKSWANFNGTGTIALRDSLNVSSLTDGATGDYLTYYSSNMANVNYSSSANTGGAGVLISSGRSGADTNRTNYYRVGVREGNSQAWTDTDLVSVTVHGDLA